MDSPCSFSAGSKRSMGPRGDERGRRLMVMLERSCDERQRRARSARPGCIFSLFWSCFAPVIAASQATPTDAAVRPFPVFLPWLTGKSPAPGCVRCPVFLLLFTGIYRQAGVDRTLPLRPETRKCFRDLARGHCASAASAAHPIPTRAGTGRPRRRSRRVRSRRSPPPCGRRGRARGRQAPPGDCWALPSPRRGEARARSPIRRAAG